MSITERITPKTDGPVPLIIVTAEEIGIRSIIDAATEWNKDKCIVSPGTVVEAMISGCPPVRSVGKPGISEQ